MCIGGGRIRVANPLQAASIGEKPRRDEHGSADAWRSYRHRRTTDYDPSVTFRSVRCAPIPEDAPLRVGAPARLDGASGSAIVRHRRPDPMQAGRGRVSSGLDRGRPGASDLSGASARSTGHSSFAAAVQIQHPHMLREVKCGGHVFSDRVCAIRGHVIPNEPTVASPPCRTSGRAKACFPRPLPADRAPKPIRFPSYPERCGDQNDQTVPSCSRRRDGHPTGSSWTFLISDLAPATHCVSGATVQRLPAYRTSHEPATSSTSVIVRSGAFRVA